MFFEANFNLMKRLFPNLDDMNKVWEPALSVYEYAKYLVDMKD
jgi:hypothetical protein